jgi:RHS repeat-associated protein
VYDGLGSVVGEVDVVGNLTATCLFDVYGAKRGGSGTSTTKQGFVGGLGHETDDETGLIYMRARYYDPGVGRFVSEDVAHSGMNWFAYCDSDPINKYDPSGNVVLINLLFGGEGSSAMDIAEARMAQLFQTWAENRVATALCIWAAKFGQELIFEEEDLGGVEWQENENLPITGCDGKWDLRLDFSGHDDLPPHINFSSQGGAVSDLEGNHWIIE